MIYLNIILVIALYRTEIVDLFGKVQNVIMIINPT